VSRLEDLDIGALPREELPALLGRLVELEARIRLRLAETPAQPAAPASRAIDPDEGAAIAGQSRRWLLARTRGLAFRRDHSRKVVVFDEAGLRRWLLERRP
jgi:hypothetical protein